MIAQTKTKSYKVSWFHHPYDPQRNEWKCNLPVYHAPHIIPLNSGTPSLLYSGRNENNEAQSKLVTSLLERQKKCVEMQFAHIFKL